MADGAVETGFVRRKLHVENVARRTDSVWLFTFRPDEGVSTDDLVFNPGQVAVLALPGFGEAYLAIASPPDDPTRLEFLVKRSGDIGAQLCDLGQSAHAELVGFVGRGFPIDEFPSRNLLFVAAGTAIAPIRAAISHAVKQRDRFDRIVLVHGVRRPEDYAVDDEIDVWRASGVDVRLTVTQPGESAWNGHVGRVQTLVADALTEPGATAAFVCGSDEMMVQTTELLESLGVAPERILRNY